MRGPDKGKTERARGLRKVENGAEEALWFELRDRRLNGFKFVRQLPIGRYFADFACRQVHLVIEVDGSQHANSRHDTRRDDYMTSEGWNVVRFWNGCVLQDRERVLGTIVEIVENRLVQEIRAFDLTFVPAKKVDAGQ
ncbi:endonuclease domain-containing protein [Rhizobium sp. PL01]|jgi:very-short-patch-repair endonuclease|uniref:endonuclease domain-containing protein n=1 Tax=Rhizobium sp. PL01 TaxID=3085631 RepID=UPI0029814138|nr:DUF559 domain-containing protein [Rhizobium sp. PL01]MDW5315068.1 DUF559 domain-containing protein [Rhizobium sp. PL01]